MIRGKFVVFEGIDGSGKSTLAESVFNHYSQLRADQDRRFPAYPNVVWTREPTQGTHGMRVRESTGAEQLLHFLLDRRVHNRSIQRDRIDGCLVLCDRYWPSTVVYQGHVLGEAVVTAGRLLQGKDVDIDLLVYLDCPADLAMERIQEKRKSNFDAPQFENLEFLQGAWKRYEDLMVKYRGPSLQLAAEWTVEELTKAVVNKIGGL